LGDIEGSFLLLSSDFVSFRKRILEKGAKECKGRSTHSVLMLAFVIGGKSPGAGIVADSRMVCGNAKRVLVCKFARKSWWGKDVFGEVRQVRRQVKLIPRSHHRSFPERDSHLS
jgi:hypothetical protein